MGYLYEKIKESNLLTSRILSSEHKFLLEDFCRDSYYIQLKENGELLEIVGYSFEDSLYYVCRYANCTVEKIPANPEELLKKCMAEPKHFYLSIPS